MNLTRMLDKRGWKAMASTFTTLVMLGGFLPLASDGFCGERVPLDILAAKASKSLSAVDAEKAEVQLAANPNSLDVRAQLLGYYFMHYKTDGERSARVTHILWVIKNCPSESIAGSAFASFTKQSDPGFAAAKTLWLQQLEAHKENANILGNAAWFFYFAKSDLAAPLFLRAKALDPSNPSWDVALDSIKKMEEVGNSGGAMRNLDEEDKKR